MTSKDRETITRRTEKRHLLRRMKAGLGAAKNTPCKGLLLWMYFVAAVIMWLFRGYLFALDSYGEFPIVKDTTPNMMNPRLYTTSYNKP